MSSCQIWSHSLCALWLGCTVSQCIDCVPDLTDLVHVPTRYVKWVATQPYTVVLHVTTYTMLGMPWWLLYRSSCQIWSHSLGDPWLGWTASQRCCRPGRPDHAPTKYVKWVATHPWHVVLHVTRYTNLRMAWLFCSSQQIWPHSLGALWVWTDSTHVYDWVSGLLYLAHVLIKHMKYLVTHPWPVVLT